MAEIGSLELKLQSVREQLRDGPELRRKNAKMQQELDRLRPMEANWEAMVEKAELLETENERLHKMVKVGGPGWASVPARTCGSPRLLSRPCDPSPADTADGGSVPQLMTADGDERRDRIVELRDRVGDKEDEVKTLRRQVELLTEQLIRTDRDAYIRVTVQLGDEMQ